MGKPGPLKMFPTSEHKSASLRATTDGRQALTLASRLRLKYAEMMNIKFITTHPCSKYEIP